MLYAAIFIPLLIATVCTGGWFAPVMFIVLLMWWSGLAEEEERIKANHRRQKARGRDW